MPPGDEGWGMVKPATVGSSHPPALRSRDERVGGDFTVAPPLSIILALAVTTHLAPQLPPGFSHLLYPWTRETYYGIWDFPNSVTPGPPSQFCLIHLPPGLLFALYFYLNPVTEKML